MSNSNIRPFLSIVIPCYNNGQYAPGLFLDRLLNSIKEQELSKEDLEVIISDDCSPLPYQGTIDRYKDDFIIKFIQTDYNSCPGNTRQKGIELVTGQWLCFADHDDVFAPHGLQAIKLVIEHTKEKYMIETDFNKVSDSDLNEVIEKFRYPKLGTWVHGKFYNVDNFWQPMKLHFIKDLKTHEDLALGRLVECAMHKLNSEPRYVNIITYKWVYRSDSISHGTYKQSKVGNFNHSFFETHFNDFLESQVGSLIEAYHNENITRDEAIILSLNAIASSYLSVMTFRVEQPHPLRSPEAYASKMWQRIKSEFEFSAAIAKLMYENQLITTRDKVNKVAQEFNQLELADWIDTIDDLDADKIIDEETAEQIRGNKPAQLKQNENNSSKQHRPFFSIIVPCWNDGRYREGVYLDRLLSSIERQGMNKEDIEVILSDDCSLTPFDHIIAKHEDALIIKYIKTDYNFAPGNTRAKGLTIATGEWLAFADHDDIYYDGALKKMHDAIIEKNEQHFAFGDFNGVNEKGEVIKKYECHLNWCHGKFYNKDNFWDKYGIHFIKDLKSHEDIAICTQVSCALSANIKNYTYLHVPVYAWTDNPQSVSHAKYTVDTEDGPREFLEVFYEDYIHSTGYIYIEKFKEHSIKMEYAIKCSLEIVCYCYFYSQGFQFRRPDDFYKRNLEIAGEFLDTLKKTFNVTNQSMYNAIASNGAYMYYQIRDLANGGSGRYIPSQTLRQWIDLVSP